MSEFKIDKILIIDDSEDFRNLLLKFFEKVCPHSDISVYDLLKGKPPETFDWEQYDLIILDYDLGNGENGLEWLKCYKTSRSFPATIMLTAQGNEEVVVKAFRYGAQDYLSKSGLTKGRLIDSVKCALEKHKKESEQAEPQQARVHLYNKDRFYRSLENVQKNDVIILSEIDKFQSLRDEIGLLTADKLANFVSEKILKIITDSNYAKEITRIGDSSVAILIRDYQNDDKGSKICEEICKIFDQATYEGQSGAIEFSLSLAAIFVTSDQADSDTILKQADSACRIARKTPGNSFIINETASSADEVEVDTQLAAQIQNAFSEERVKPHYQALIKLSDMAPKFESIEYYQVRINLIDLDEGPIEAREFLPVLKNSKMLKDLDRWLINSCLQQIAINNTSDTGRAGFFVSITEESLTDIMFSKWLESELAVLDLDSINDALVLEISADNYIRYQKQASFLIKTLRQKHNILFALTKVDETSSLQQCLSLSSFDFIMFTPFYDDKNMTEQQVHTIVNKAKEFSCLSVANKIESNESMVSAMSCNLDFICGYFVQPPQDTFLETEVVEV